MQEIKKTNHRLQEWQLWQSLSTNLELSASVSVTFFPGPEGTENKADYCALILHSTWHRRTGEKGLRVRLAARIQYLLTQTLFHVHPSFLFRNRSSPYPSVSHFGQRSYRHFLQDFECNIFWNVCRWVTLLQLFSPSTDTHAVPMGKRGDLKYHT